MDKLFLIQFAFRNMVGHRMRTVLTLIGIMIGISAIVFLVAFAFGIEKLVTSEVTGGDAFKLVDVGTGSSQVVKLNNDAVANIKKIADAKTVETTINLAAKAVEGDSTMDVAFFANSPKYLEWSGIRPNVGKAYHIDKSSDIIINTACLSFFKLTAEQAVGKSIKLNLILPKELLDAEENKIVDDKEFTIVGVVQDDSNPNVYANQSSISDYKVVNFSQAKVEIASPDRVLELRKQIEGMGFKTQYVGDTVSQIEQIFSVFKIILGSFGLIALIVASLGMFNTLTISLLERMKEVALLKILGTKRRDISSLFMTEALMFGVVGGTLGVILGIATGAMANYALNVYAKSNGGDAVIVFSYPAWFILAILAFAILVGVLTGIYPAKRAATVSSLDVIRYE